MASPVNTTIPVKWHDLARANNISWTKAVMIGLEVLLDPKFHKIEDLTKKLAKLRKLVELYEDQLKNLLIEEQKQKEKEAEYAKIKSNSCDSCEQILEDKQFNYRGKKYCRTCYMSDNLITEKQK